MEIQKIAHFLNGSDNEKPKFARKKWYVIDSESKGVYSHHDPIKFLTKSIKSSLCDYSDAYISVTGNIAVLRTHSANLAANPAIPKKEKQPLNAATQVAFKHCAPFEKYSTEIDEVNFINITMPMYNLIEYSDNYSDTSGSLWGFKRDGIDNNANVAYDNNALSFKYKAELIANTEADGTKRRIKITVPLKYLSNFWRSLEMPLINCKVELSLRWIKNCVLTTAEINAIANAFGADSATFKCKRMENFLSPFLLYQQTTTQNFQNY